jgi:hypothetical protein
LIASNRPDTLDPALILSHNSQQSSPADGAMATDQQGHPVIRTLFDHVEDAFLEIFANDRAP